MDKLEASLRESETKLKESHQKELDSKLNEHLESVKKINLDNESAVS